MPKKVANSKPTKAEKKNASKPIKKEAKDDNKKQAIDDAVLNAKGTTHYVLLLDDSGSMAGKPFKDLKEACANFLNALVKSREANSAKISCIMYNNNSRTVFQNETPSAKLIDHIN